MFIITELLKALVRRWSPLSSPMLIFIALKNRPPELPYYRLFAA